MLSNSYSSRNIGIPNSIILNNYSIQNLIITPKELDPFYQMSLPTYENYTEQVQPKNPISYSPSPKKLPLKSFNSLYFKPINFDEPNQLLTSQPSFNNINLLRASGPPIITQTEKNSKIIPIKNIILDREKAIERHPQDSVSRKKVKKNGFNFQLNNRNKNNINKINLERNKVVLRTAVSQKHLNISKNILNKSNKDLPFPKNNLSKRNNPQLKSTKIIYIEPKELVNLKEFLFEEQIGKGTFGKIFSVKWKKNNKHYAMKKEILNEREDYEKRKKNCKIIQNFVNKTGSKGVINLYGNLCFKKKTQINLITQNFQNDVKPEKFNEYIYYELMEKAERDWDKEINIRSQYQLFYTEKEIINIINQLVSTLSLMQKYHITHRDIKPQNILVSNGQYKLCDYGEIRVLQRDGLIVQRVRGSELYMSPILFNGLHQNLIQVKHNTYKSDVFSLGMCLFYASSLTYGGVDSIRELNDMNEIKKIIFNYLGMRYSEKLILLILSMLEIDENKRPNFIQLEKNNIIILKNLFRKIHLKYYSFLYNKFPFAT